MNRCIHILLIIASLLFACSEKKSTGIEHTFSIEQVPRSPEPDGVNLAIVSPADGSQNTGPLLEVYFILTNWQLEPGGNKLRFVLDGGEPVDHYELNKPLVLEDVSAGAHCLQAFPVRKNGESLKNPGAFSMVQFVVDEPLESQPFDKSKPILIYNSPTGSIPPSSSAEIMLDYIVIGAPIGIYDYQIRYILDDTKGVFTTWKPALIKGLSEGKHKLTIDLYSPDGKPVLGNYNRTVRTFIVESQ